MKINYSEKRSENREVRSENREERLKTSLIRDK